VQIANRAQSGAGQRRRGASGAVVRTIRKDELFNGGDRSVLGYFSNVTDALDDTTLWTLFDLTTLPKGDWTHAAHLRTAWLFLRRHALDEAHLLMRVGIIKLNASHGLVETASRGYHETLTRVWLALVNAAQRRTPALADSREFLRTHAEQLGKDAPLRHYSRERLFSVEARARFITPDLAPLPGDFAA
jgi:hypothetical protein